MTKTQQIKYNGLTAGLKGAKRKAMIAFVEHRHREQEIIVAACSAASEQQAGA